MMGSNDTPEILSFFSYEHLPEDLRHISKECSALAHYMAGALPRNSAETTAGLRKLLEAKDCFVRAVLSTRGKRED